MIALRLTLVTALAALCAGAAHAQSAYIKAGRIRPLAVTTENRSPVLPDEN